MQNHFVPDPPPTFPRPTSPQILANWDVVLQSLWATETEASRTGACLYKSLSAETPGDELSIRATEAITLFRTHLAAHTPQMPVDPDARYRAVATALWYPLRHVRQSPAQPFIEDRLEIALRPVQRLQVGALIAEICAALYDYHRGVWAAHLTRPQRRKIETVLAATLSSLPPDEMQVFWENLHSENTMMRGAMRLGLEWLTSDHAVPHLLCGLDRSADSETRFAIVDNLARIGDPRVLPHLYALRRSAALTDWPLSRRVSAAIGVIEHLNRNQRSLRSLLRPAPVPSSDPANLLHPTNDFDSSPTTLPRPADPPSP